MHDFSRSTGALLVVNVQERLVPAMPQHRLERFFNRVVAAIEGAKALGLPIVVTEQYPKGLGHTVARVAERLAPCRPFEKLDFSAVVPGVTDALGGRTQVLVVGMETHVCVFQTVRALARGGAVPHLAMDAVLSRVEADERAGLELCRGAGAVLTSVEAALFDALVRAGGPEFKAISAAVR